MAVLKFGAVDLDHAACIANQALGGSFHQPTRTVQFCRRFNEPVSLRQENSQVSMRDAASRLQFQGASQFSLGFVKITIFHERASQQLMRLIMCRRQVQRLGKTEGGPRSDLLSPGFPRPASNPERPGCAES